MSISDRIVVMKDGEVQQIGKPQQVYDDPANLFVAKFLGTPPINVFEGQIKGDALYIGSDCVLSIKDTGADRAVYVGVRPEGFVPEESGALCCALQGVEVMGKDVSILATHPAFDGPVVRAVVSSEMKNAVDLANSSVHFTLKPHKVFLFEKENGLRIPFSVK